MYVYVCVCIYIAYRELGLPRKLQVISAASNNTPKEVAQDYRHKAISKRESLASSKLRKVEYSYSKILSAKYNM
jgi:transcription initiation factor TFIIIB Brf1 subunit/transcription initiation factor TFIIB